MSSIPKPHSPETGVNALFFLPYAQEAAGCRFRVHQFVPFLESHGVRCDLRELIDSDLYSILYRPGNRIRKFAQFSKAVLGRLHDLVDAKDHDLIFVYRECFPFGPAVLESYLRSLGKPIVYDFDDAIYMLQDGGRLKNLLRTPEKTNVITRMSDEVIVCNDQLRGLCAAYNKNVHVIPTSVNTDLFRARHYPIAPPTPSREHPLRLGWIGSHSTAKYLDIVKGALRRLAERHPIEFLVVGAGRDVSVPGVRVINKTWTLDSEVEDFRSLDIGVYPLADDLWERGKTGFKTVQFMATAVPGVISRVGASCTFVRDGENAFLAGSEDEWVEKLSLLCDNYELRRRVGMEGRRTAVEDFSVAANAPKLLDIIRHAASTPRRPL